MIVKNQQNYILFKVKTSGEKNIKTAIKLALFIELQTIVCKSLSTVEHNCSAFFKGVLFFCFSAKLKQYYEELVKQLEISRSSSISEPEFQEAVRKLEERHNKVLEKRKSV